MARRLPGKPEKPVGSDSIYQFLCFRNFIMELDRDLLGIGGLPLDSHLVNVGSIPTDPTHSEGRLQL